MVARQSKISDSPPLSPIIAIVDADHEFRTALHSLLASSGYSVESFASAGEFTRYRQHGGAICLLLELHLPDKPGLELQAELVADEYPPLIIFVTAFGTIRQAVEAIKAGAFDFLEKPCEPQALLNRVRDALTHVATRQQSHGRRYQTEIGFGQLTRREREICRLILAGLTNRNIADQLRLSLRTVENHRARILSKMAVESTIELVRLMARVEVPSMAILNE